VVVDVEELGDVDDVDELAAKAIPAPPRANPTAVPPARAAFCTRLRRRRVRLGPGGGTGGAGGGSKVMVNPALLLSSERPAGLAGPRPGAQAHTTGILDQPAIPG
jgi:hypothetical protein